MSDKDDEQREAENLKRDDQDRISAERVGCIIACSAFEKAILTILETEQNLGKYARRKFTPYFQNIDDDDIKIAMSYLQRYLKD